MRFFRLLFPSVFLISLLPAVCSAQQQGTALQVPAFTAYAEPNGDSIDFPDSGPVTGWSNSQTHLVWYGLLRQQGELHLALHLTIPQGEQVTLALKFDGQKSVSRNLSGNGSEQAIDFGSV